MSIFAYVIFSKCIITDTILKGLNIGQIYSELPIPANIHLGNFN